MRSSSSEVRQFYCSSQTHRRNSSRHSRRTSIPRSDPERAIEIDGAIGDGSPFHDTYGYYAHGVGPETRIAPEGWESRMVRIETHDTLMRGIVIGWGLEIHDLVLAKLAAGRAHALCVCRGCNEQPAGPAEPLARSDGLVRGGHHFRCVRSHRRHCQRGRRPFCSTGHCCDWSL
jgi:hypothetical protein